MKWFIGVAAFAAMAVSFAACGNTTTGYSCTMGSFSGTECLQRIKDSKCADGGVVITTKPDGGNNLSCCTWVECASSPYTGAIGE